MTMSKPNSHQCRVKIVVLLLVIKVLVQEQERPIAVVLSIAIRIMDMERRQLDARIRQKHVQLKLVDLVQLKISQIWMHDPWKQACDYGGERVFTITLNAEMV